ncbi:MAG TPA: type IV toxin-antitoxin system AbiEi family antitoxin domain-containing protein [Mycobacteriales bacterium]|nr:type IV toxin-antitoxin system AbiEi family antitoxin domain-containing protein [Mycobacteriales bacterium]
MSLSFGISTKGRAELTAALAGSRRFLTPASVAADLGIDRAAAARKLAAWASQGWVRRVRRGLYIGVPVDATNPAAWSEDALVVATEVWSPCYFTGWTAANHWGLTEQTFRTTVLKTTMRVRSDRARLLDHDYLLAHAPEGSMSWGVKSQWSAEIRLPFADPARTVIDALDTPKLAGGIRHVSEILDAFLDEHDSMQLVDYGDRLGNGAVFKRLGYLLDALVRDLPAVTSACQERITAGVSPLDPDGPSAGRRVMRWGLRINVTISPVEPS